MVQWWQKHCDPNPTLAGACNNEMVQWKFHWKTLRRRAMTTPTLNSASTDAGLSAIYWAVESKSNCECKNLCNIYATSMQIYANLPRSAVSYSISSSINALLAGENMKWHVGWAGYKERQTIGTVAYVPEHGAHRCGWVGHGFWILRILVHISLLCIALFGSLNTLGWVGSKVRILRILQILARLMGLQWSAKLEYFCHILGNCHAPLLFRNTPCILWNSLGRITRILLEILLQCSFMHIYCWEYS